MPHAGDFTVASCQATLFTPDGDVSVARFMSRLLPRWIARFDGEPMVFPLPAGIPKEVPKIVLQSRNQDWRCEVASAQINLFWRRPSPEFVAIGVQEFYRLVLPLLEDYRGFIDLPITRLAAVVVRYAIHDDPARYLAHHFCRDRWMESPFNRPENFELHAHKVFRLTEGLSVNSWVRNKSGQLKGTDRSIVVVEQDLNTLVEEMHHEFSVEESNRFFDAASIEFDTILNLYYPPDIG